MSWQLAKNEDGSIAILFGLASFIVIGLAGLALDQSAGYSRQQQLQVAADAAVLAASKSLADGENWAQAKTLGENIFVANMRDLPGAKIDLKLAGGLKDAQAAATAEVPWKRTLTKIFDSAERTIKITSGSLQPRRPVEIIFVADVSYSMGIGAARSDIDIMMRTIGCAFACHVDGTDTRVRAGGARLRIDVIQDAFREAIREIKRTKQAEDDVRVGLITFSNSVVDSVLPSKDLDAVETNANLIKFPAGDSQGGTDLHAAAAAAALMIDERKRQNAIPATYVVIWLTDGIEDTKMLLPGRVHAHDYTFPITTPNFAVDAHTTMKTFAPDLCNGIKEQGAQVLILNTKYVVEGWSLAAAGSTQLATLLLPIMPERLEMCASKPEYVQHANDPAAILNAVGMLSRLAISKALRVAN